MLNSDGFYSLKESKIIIEAWRRYNSTPRPNSLLSIARWHQRLSSDQVLASQLIDGSRCANKLTLRLDTSIGIATELEIVEDFSRTVFIRSNM
jgi:hypothetical protein